MPFSLYRTRDGAGDSGPMSEAWMPNPEAGSSEPAGDRPVLGAWMRVGSPYGRTFVAQDWWQTTPITEIIEEREDYVRFRTRNSEYEWKRF